MKKYFITVIICLIFGLSTSNCLAKTTTTASKTKTTTSKSVKISAKVTWTPAALRELNRVPRFVRSSVKKKINDYAIKHKIKVITPKIYNSIHV